MQFDEGAEALREFNAVSVRYKDRMWEIDLNSAKTGGREASSIAFDLQAALNLARPPVGLQLHVAPGAEAVVCPLSVLVACPSYIASTFQGMSWIPLLEGGADEDDADLHGLPSDPFLPPPLGSPLGHDMSSLADCGPTASPSEGCGRPLTAPPGDRTRGMPRPRPGRREGLGRPMSATPSDKSFGMRRLRPEKSEGFGRPTTALPSDHSGSGSPAWGLRSPRGFRCEDGMGMGMAGSRPATAPAFVSGPHRRSASSLNASRNVGAVTRHPFGEGGGVDVDAVAVGDGFEHGSRVTVEQQSEATSPGGGADGVGTSWAWRRTGPARDCWV